MRHAKIPETPREAGDDILPAGGKQAAAEGILRAVLGVYVHGFQCRHVKVLRRDDRDRNCEHGAEHQKALEKVRPAHGLVAAEEGIDDDNQREEEHCRLVRQAREHHRKDRRARNKRGGNIDREAHEENNGADDLQSQALRRKAVRQVLRKRDRVVRGLREAAKTARDDDPVRDRAEGETDTDPDLAKAEGQDRAGKTHQQPRRHVGCLRAHCRDPRAHMAAAKEIFLLACAALFEEEKHADGKHQHKVQYERENLCIHHKTNSLTNFSQFPRILSWRKIDCNTERGIDYRPYRAMHKIKFSVEFTGELKKTFFRPNEIRYLFKDYFFGSRPAASA